MPYLCRPGFISSYGPFRGAVFDRCDMERTSFFRTNLEKADLSTSFHFIIDPAENRLKKAVFSEAGLRGLVAQWGIVIREADEF